MNAAERAYLRRSQLDPVWWIRTHLGVEPWELQRRIIESVRDNRRTAVRSCHAAGKSFTAALAALWFLYTHPESIVLTTAPTQTQVSKIIWKEIRSLHANAPAPLGGEFQPKSPELMLGEKHYAFGFATNMPARAQGIHARHLLLIFDEAAGIHRDIWTGFQGVLASASARFLAIANPTEPTGPFYDEFKPGVATTFSISAFDTPNVIAGRELIPGLVTKEWIEDRRQWGIDSPMYRSRVLGQFPDSATNMLVPLSWWDAACAREFEARATDANVLGVDVAGSGECFTVAVHRHGPRARVVYRVNGANAHEIAGNVIRLQREHGRGEDNYPTANIDANGIGAELAGLMEAAGRRCSRVIVSRASTDPEVYLNKRAELFWRVRERFNPGPDWPRTDAGRIDVSADDEHLGAQLTSLRWKPNARGQIQIESKVDMENASPDDADALALTFDDSDDSGALEWDDAAGLPEFRQ